MEFDSLFDAHVPVIGMVHLLPLPGAPGADSDLSTVRERASSDAEALEAGGVDGIMIENFGDAPFHPDDVPKHTVAAMTSVAGAVSHRTDLPIGINVLRNDAAAAIAVAHAVDAAFVRVNVHTGARVTDQGIIEGRAHETLRIVDRLGADIGIFADVDVKHSSPVGTSSSLETSFIDLAERGHADAAVVSGVGTGEPADTGALTELAAVKDRRNLSCPVLVGSGVTPETLPDVYPYADGVIVGTALKTDAVTTNPVEEAAVRRFVDAIERLRG